MPLPLPSCVLQFLKYEQTVGVLAIVLGEMKADVGYFFVILMVLTVGFGVAFATLLRASQVLLPPLSPPPPSPHHPPLHTAPGAFSRRFLQALMPLPPPSLRASQVEPWYVGCVQSGRLGGATAGHHGLHRLHLKAWGCPPHSGGEERPSRSDPTERPWPFRRRPPKLRDNVAAFDHPGTASSAATRSGARSGASTAASTSRSR